MTDTSGPMSYEPFARWDHDSQSWKTSEATSLWALTLSSLTLPQWGGLHDGELCERPTPARLTSGLDYSSLPTPNAADGKRYNLTHQRGEGNPTLLGAVHHLPTPSANDTTGAEDQVQRQNRGGDRSDELLLPGLVKTFLPTPKATNNENRQSLDRYGMNLGMALQSLGETTAQPSPDGKPSQDDEPQHLLSQESLAIPA